MFFVPNYPTRGVDWDTGSGALGHHPFVLEMIYAYIDNYCTEFMIIGGMVCTTILSTIVSLKIFNFS